MLFSAVHFPVTLHIGPWVLPSHPIFESLAYFVGGRVYFAIRRRNIRLNQHHGAAHENPSTDQSLWIAVGAIIGAAIGAKLLSLLEDPWVLLNHVTDLAYWTGGQTIVGSLLGGLVGVELAKKRVGWRQSTGDEFVLPLIVGMCIGRMGCFLAGLPDHTYGTPTRLPFGVNFGDGIPRHPTQLYEIAFLLLWGAILYGVTRRTPQRRGNIERVDTPSGVRFQLFMFGYLMFRFLVEFIKPTPHIYFGLSNIQLASIVGMLYYAPKLWRWLRAATSTLEAAQHA